MCAGQGALRDIRIILLLQHNGLVRTLKQAAKFLHDIGEPILLSDLVEERIHAEISMYEASVGYNRRVAVKIKLIKEQQQPYLEFVGIEQGSKRLLRNGKRLQYWVFDLGDDHGSIILQDLDLRINPFKGREYGAILIRLKLKGWDLMNGLANTLIKAWLNGQFQGLIRMIYEVLDRERMRTLDTALQQLEQEGLNHQIKPGVEKLNKPGAEKLIKLGAEKLIIVSDRAGLVSNKEEMKSNSPELKLSFRDLNYLPNMHLGFSDLVCHIQTRSLGVSGGAHKESCNQKLDPLYLLLDQQDVEDLKNIRRHSKIKFKSWPRRNQRRTSLLLGFSDLVCHIQTRSLGVSGGEPSLLCPTSIHTP
ncbi:hypothetical protein F2Q68_00014519 [Brassica cretica]|uniref:Uncharacterized protein n=1 Tax=Brassica cretica TaxID=69181 RepID=A0A8S9HFF6_BRACR|nr:hypothetical protein F2Q68_00014519 [Brassica cretica]